MIGIGTKTIETDRLILRRIKLEDASQIYKNWTSDPLVSKQLEWNVHQSIDDTLDYVNSKLEAYNNDFFYDWVVVLKKTNEPIGEISSVRIQKKHDLVELGYNYGSKFWGNGYASEALKAVIKFLKEEAKVYKVICAHISTNPASGKVMQKAGMEYDGTLKDYRIDKSTNERVDLIYYSSR